MDIYFARMRHRSTICDEIIQVNSKLQIQKRHDSRSRRVAGQQLCDSALRLQSTTPRHLSVIASDDGWYKGGPRGTNCRWQQVRDFQNLTRPSKAHWQPPPQQHFG